MGNERFSELRRNGRQKGILHLTSGEIVVESEKGKGSKFTITLPMELKQ